MELVDVEASEPRESNTFPEKHTQPKWKCAVRTGKERVVNASAELSAPLPAGLLGVPRSPP